MKQKKLIRLLSLLCLIALVTVSTAYAYGTSSNWAVPELDAMEALGLIPQALAEKPDLRVEITRLEMCAIAVQAFETYTGQEIPVENPAPFTDTDSLIAAKAYATGLVKGYEDGTFHPTGILSRQEFFSFIYQFLQAVQWTPTEAHFSDLAGFPDAGTVSQWALPAVRLVVGIGVVEGNGSGLAPHNTTTCEQALAMFYRCYTFLMEQMPPANTPEVPFGEKYNNLDKWAEEELAPMDEQGLIPAILLGRDMASPITRREMCHVAVAAYLALRPETVGLLSASPFSDVDDETVTLAYELGLVSGFPDGTFLPDNPITREQFYKITVNFLTAMDFPRADSPATDLSGFTDAGQLQAYAQPCARLLVSLGILKGNGSTLSPKASTQCQQALALFFRSYNFLCTWIGDGQEPGERAEAEALVEFALQFEGYDYVWGGKEPATGFDCSGLVYYVFHYFNYPVGRTATAQWEYEDSWEVSPAQLLPGDLVFFSDTYSLDNITHVGIYIGNDEFLHAANSRSGVIVTSTESSYYTEKLVGARRIIP